MIVALNPDLSAGDRAAVAGRCDGVPFYIEQVVGGLSETGVPEALYEPLFARLRASATVVPVLEAAAVIGRQMDRGLLCSVVDLSDDAVDDVIDELEDALVLEPWGSDGWRFRHELLRELAAELAPPTVRRGCTPRWPTPRGFPRRRFGTTCQLNSKRRVRFPHQGTGVSWGRSACRSTGV